LQVENAPRIKKDVRLHPNNERLGERKVETSNIFYIPFEDVEKLEVDEIFRLKDLYNVRIKNKNSIIKGEYVGKKLIQDKLKIQWTTDKFIKMNIFIPGLLFNNGDYNPDSLEELEGYAEESVANLKTDEIVQFERFGFVRIENKDGKIMGYYSHK
jgi:glutamyl-tRNA synthetase